MAASPEPVRRLSVPAWTNTLSGLQSRHPGFWIRLGNLETRLLTERLDGIAIEKPVWISGLARSGTTILLELLARHPDAATHRYRDFPPVLVPWTWNWFVDRAGGGDQPAEERAHGDGIDVTPESPEAFEEVIWMAFFSGLHDPESPNPLGAGTENPAFETFYRDHLRKMLAIRGGRRYVAKANYNLTRLPYLLKLFPDARFVVPFRDPPSHIASLMRQHEHFCREHARDGKLQHHMSRSGHFEFGLDRRPLNRGNADATRKIRDLWSAGREVEGWALYWKDLHGYVADLLESDANLRAAVMLVDYDRFCEHPRETMYRLLDHCRLSRTSGDPSGDPSGDLSGDLSGDVSGDLAGEAARLIRPPSRRPLPFDEQQAEAVTAATGAVYERLRALASADAQGI